MSALPLKRSGTPNLKNNRRNPHIFSDLVQIRRNTYGRRSVMSLSCKDALFSCLFILLAFGIVYWMSMSFVYIEGDDALIVAHHSLGRNWFIQPPYNSYQSMMDTLLRFLPPREDIIRVFGMGLSAVCAPISFGLIIILSIDLLGDIVPKPRWLLVATMLLVAPEFYYLGMVLTPALLAMTFVLTAHLTIRRSVDLTGMLAWFGFVTSLLLFAIGAGIRWETVAYGATITADLFLYRRCSFLKVLLWGFLAGAAWLIVLNLTGYGLSNVLRLVTSSGWMDPLDWKMFPTRIHTLVTPGFAVICAVGLVLLVRRRHPLSVITVICMLPVAKFVLYGTPKWIITAWPCLLACCLAGLSILWRRRSYRYAVLALMISPWLVGVRMNYAGTAWGPGFEIQRYDKIPQKTSLPSLTFGAGTAVPTPEGPRALFGHAWVFTGEWRRFVADYWREQESAVELCIQRDMPLLLQDYGQGWGIVSYVARGYKTSDPQYPTIGNGLIVERHWIRMGEKPSMMFQFVDTELMFDAKANEQLRQVAGDTMIISAWSNTLGKLYRIAPDCLQPLGNVTAVLHLNCLCERLRSLSISHKSSALTAN
jgi:hypothetical protein